MDSKITIYEISDSIQITSYGDWIYKLTGYDSMDEFKEHETNDAFSPIWTEDIDKVKKEIQRIQKGETNSIYLLIRMKCKDGNPKYVNMHGTVFDKTSEKITMYVIYTDAND